MFIVAWNELYWVSSVRAAVLHLMKRNVFFWVNKRSKTSWTVFPGTARLTLWSTSGSSGRRRSPDSDFYLLWINDTKALHSNTNTPSLQEIQTTCQNARKLQENWEYLKQNFVAVFFFSFLFATFLKKRLFISVSVSHFSSVDKSSSSVEAGVSDS